MGSKGQGGVPRQVGLPALPLEWKNYHFSPLPAEKVMSLGRNWHRPCLRCQRCRKTLTAGSHAEVSRAGMGGYVGRREAGAWKRG